MGSYHGLVRVAMWWHCVEFSCLALLRHLPEYLGILLETAVQTLPMLGHLLCLQ